jgi:beta-glucosidase-like glycosyl hydrolase
MGNDLEQDDEIIELTQVLDDESLNTLEQDSQDHEVIELTDIHIPTDETQDNDLVVDSSLVESSISQEKLDEALERVIEKKFAGKIEKILFEVMEKVIEKEIVDLKARLQKDLDEIGNT